MLNPATGWFEIVEVPSDLVEEVVKKIVTTETIIDKSSARISRLFEQTWLSRYPRPRKVVFDNGSEFNRFQGKAIFYVLQLFHVVRTSFFWAKKSIARVLSVENTTEGE